METIESKLNNYFIGVYNLRKEYTNRKIANTEKYFNELAFRIELFKNYRVDINRSISFDFNVFDYIQPDENKLSDIIADLLRVDGRHGQGDKFLHEFLKIINVEVSSTVCKIHREVYTNLIQRNLRRMDILIDFDNLGIMIENKPWAGDQDNQLSDYYQYLCKRYKDNFFIIYLSKKSDPSTNSISEKEFRNLKETGKFIHFPFQTLFDKWISNCILTCESEKMRYFLQDLKKFTQNNFNL